MPVSQMRLPGGAGCSTATRRSSTSSIRWSTRTSRVKSPCNCRGAGKSPCELPGRPHAQVPGPGVAVHRLTRAGPRPGRLRLRPSAARWCDGLDDVARLAARAAPVCGCASRKSRRGGPTVSSCPLCTRESADPRQPQRARHTSRRARQYRAFRGIHQPAPDSGRVESGAAVLHLLTRVEPGARRSASWLLGRLDCGPLKARASTQQAGSQPGPRRWLIWRRAADHGAFITFIYPGEIPGGRAYLLARRVR